MAIRYIVVLGGGGEESAGRSKSISDVRRKTSVSNLEMQERVVTKKLC